MSQIPDTPVILSVEPALALPGGEVVVHGRALLSNLTQPPQVLFGESPATIVFASPTQLTVLVPEAASGDAITITTAHGSANFAFTLGTLLAESLHPVANPAVDAAGNIYVTFSGSRGQSVPTSLFRIDDESTLHPIAAEIMNPTGLALDAIGNLYISSRHDGAVYRLSTEGDLSTYAEGMGVATGAAFDGEGNLFVGDRSGTIFKIDSKREIFVHATLEASVSAYHLAVDAKGTLFVTGPTLSSNDAIWAIEPNGDIRAWYRGLGRPQGLALSKEGDIYLAACLHGRRGLVRVTPQGEATLALAGTNLVGLAFSPLGTTILATSEAVYDVDLGVEGLRLF